ncbi:MAG: ABC transporter ATP-binding protein [Candidatus Cloacimonetes bacterium]|nr:ABC transporter ATP-binding protein [Candidatus Cloacimonadota bacterium]MBL7107979.1 ABC transporter ATP-binding protein [Candidatus Cloacimonadota bacterium]
MNTYFEEKDTDKIYDRRLMARLLKYLLPYKSYFIISFFILILIALFAIAIPYITKYAIDEHINPSIKLIDLSEFSELQENFATQYQKYIIEFDEQKFLIKSYNINKLSTKHFQKINSNNLIEDGFYVIFPQTKANNNLAKKYPNTFQKFGNHFIVEQSNLKNLSPKDTKILRSDDIRSLWNLAILLFVILILEFSFSYLQIYLTQYGAMHSMYDLRMKLFGHLQKLPLSFFDKNPIGRLVTRVTNDVNSLAEMIGEGLITLVQDLVMMLAILIMMFVINFKLALITFTVLPFVIFFMIKFKFDVRKVYRAVRIKLAKINATLSENISGIQTIQLFHQEGKMSSHFREITKEYFNAEKKQLRVFALFHPLIDLMVHITIALILWFGSGRILANMMSLGVLVLFISYAHRFFDPLYDLSQKYNILQSAMASLERIFKLMDTEPEKLVESKSEKISGNIEFKNVWMAYDKDEYVLKNINLKIKNGEKIALVGATGGGKTSLVKLLSSFYPFQKGKIFIDGKSITEYNISDLRKNIGVVQQEVFIFSGKMKDNIALYQDDFSDDEIIQAAKYVNADKFISKLPNGYNEDAKEKGSVLSAGQRQLLAFARVLVRNPSIFILDEATSNIDTETEILIQDALKKVTKNRTSIIIAHRLSTIQNVDRIIVIHKGKIVEEGTHQQLLKKRGLYFNLFKLQYK